MTMITVYKTSGSGDEEPEKKPKKVIPAGAVYFTKRKNGKLIMARNKTDKPADKGISLLAETFGIPSHRKKSPVRKRSKSIGPAPTPFLIGGVPYYYPQPGTQYQQIAFDPNNPMGMPPNLQPGPTVAGPLHAPNPKPADFEQLRGHDAHFKYVVSDQNKATSESKKNKEKSNVTRHICGHCGGLRSKRYHLQHPIIPGETPIPGFCRRCQRDASSTSGASSTEVSRRKKTKNKPKAKSGKKKVKVVDLDKVNSSSDSELESYAGRRKTNHKKNYARYAPKKDIDTVEEEESDEVERGRKGRRDHRTKHAKHQDSLSRVTRQKIWSRFRDHAPRLAPPRSPSPLLRDIKARRRKEPRAKSRSPLPLFRHVKAPKAATSPKHYKKEQRHKIPVEFEEQPELDKRERRLFEEELREAKHGRKIAVETLEKGQELAIPPSRPHNIPIYFPTGDDRLLAPENRPPRRRASQRDFQPPVIPSPENSFGSIDTSSSSRSERRRERNSHNLPHAPWGQVWESPTPKRVVTEKRVYRSKRELEEERRRDEWEEKRQRQEDIDRAILERRDQDMQAKRFSKMGEAAKYYLDDWRNENYSDVESEPPIPRRVPRASYRTDHDAYREESINDADCNYRTDTYDLPRAPSPPIPSPPTSPKRFSRRTTQTRVPDDQADRDWQKIMAGPPYPITPEGLPSIRYDFASERENREGSRRPSPMMSEEEFHEQRSSRSRGPSRVPTPEEFELPIRRSRSISRVRFVPAPENLLSQRNQSRNNSRAPSRAPSPYLDSHEAFFSSCAHDRTDERQENRSRSASRAPNHYSASRESSRARTHNREGAEFYDENELLELHVTDHDREHDRSAEIYYGELSEAPTRKRSESDAKKRVQFNDQNEYRERTTTSTRNSEVSAITDYDRKNGWENFSDVSGPSNVGGWNTSGVGPTGGW